ncbi:MAG: hypothetical protein AAGU17_01145 [Anaerolineaceae bacterium]|jgi:hypothetical protein
MSEELRTRKMKIERFDPKAKSIVLGSTFSATLDKVNYFPKHISLHCLVKDEGMVDRLSKIPVDSVILVKVHTDFEDMRNYLDEFSVGEDSNNSD